MARTDMTLACSVNQCPAEEDEEEEEKEKAKPLYRRLYTKRNPPTFPGPANMINNSLRHSAMTFFLLHVSDGYGTPLCVYCVQQKPLRPRA